MFGLSDLHQMRGRVGRSNLKAYCYLLAPPIYMLPEDGRRRLQAIEEYSDLGSGFNVAMRDLDIRGAGNLLGAEQSGFISEIGFHMYHKILDEAIRELRDGEFKDVLDEGEDNKKLQLSVETTVEPDFDARLSESYVSNVSERISLYGTLSAIANEEKLDLFVDELIDRFGEMPAAVRNLIFSIRLKLAAQNLYAEKIKTRENDLFLYFNNNLGEEFYQAPIFAMILEKIKTNPSKFEFKQGKNHLILALKGFSNLQEGLQEMITLKSSEQ